jgi:Fur family ferric uptake transcriptional regulator
VARKTSQRSAIRAALVTAARPLAADEILTSAQRRVPSLGQATVYRTVNMLVEEGWARAVVLPLGPARYEPADMEHHHHFLCFACTRAWDVEGCPAGVEHLTPAGFELVEHEVVLYGRCDDCVTDAAAKSRSSLRDTPRPSLRSDRS